jgi:lipopolysaccharide export system permease protein
LIEELYQILPLFKNLIIKKDGFNMPILWRYLMSQFFKISLFCVLAFIAVLLTMRLDEIAHFAALGAPLSYIFLFVFYQIPYILPIAIPISCLIASFLLLQRLSQTHELTALRACGFALKDILAPLLITAVFLSFVNFWIVSEAATHSHLTTNKLKSELRSINPLLLLHNKHLMRLKGIYFEALGPSRVGESAEDIVLAIPNRHQNRIQLLVGRRLRASPSLFIGQQATLISSFQTEEEDDFDNLLVENMEEFVTAVQDFSHLLQKNVWTINNELSFLLTRISEQREALLQAKQQQAPSSEIKDLQSQMSRSIADIARRASIATATFAFTLMGTAFGMSIGRKRKNISLFIAIGLTTLYLAAFFVAKGLDRNWILAAALYLAPLGLLISASLLFLRRISRGIE